MAILGLTSQYTSSQLPHGLYNDLSKAFASDVNALNPPMSNKTSYVPDDGRIKVVEKELRFTLYRHWSLEASLYHSSYVAGKMGIWKEQGIFRLRNFMGKMGLSLAQCRQAFEHMNLDLRQSLLQRIETIAPEYELTECIYRSFVRSYGLRCPAMGAADIVEGLEALLCAAHGVRIEVDAPGLAFGGAASSIGDAQGAYLAAMGGQMPGSDMFQSKRLWQLTKASTAASRKSATPDKENISPSIIHQEEDGSDKTAPADKQDEGSSQEEIWKLNFFAAFRALDTKRSENLNLLRASLNLSKSLHEVIVRQGVNIIDKQMIRTLRNFRLVVLKEGSSNDVKLFHNTQVLTKLGFWLVDTLRDLIQRTYKLKTKGIGEEVDSLPFVIAALNEKEDVYTVVGINGSMTYGDTLKNNFGRAFNQAVNECGSRSRHDSFNTSIVEIRGDDFSSFLESLNSIL
jgi:cell division control protein 45